MLTPSSTPNQIRSMPKLLRHRAKQWHHDKRQLEEVEEERQHEDQDVDHDQKPTWPPGKPVSRCSTHLGPSTPWNARLKMVEPIQDKHYEAGQFHCRIKRLFQRSETQPPPGYSHYQRTDGPHRAALSRGSDARKIVPSTRKISNSGGISTKVTRSAMRDSRPQPVSLLTTAATGMQSARQTHGNNDCFVKRN